MSALPDRSHSARTVVICGIAFLAIIVAGMIALEWSNTNEQKSRLEPPNAQTTSVPIPPRPETPQDLAAVKSLCANCHVLPLPSSFSKDRWPQIVHQWYDHARNAEMRPEGIVSEEVATRYFQNRAPETLDFNTQSTSFSEKITLRFAQHHYRALDLPPLPRVTNVKWAALKSQRGLDALVCDMQHGLVLLWEFDHPERGLTSLAEVKHPAHVEVVDLNRDGHQDLLVADLGTFFPDDSRNGRIVWLKYNPNTANYETVVIAKGLGRVADVQAADFDSDGDDDLVAAVFGWRAVGEVLYLENRSDDPHQPNFRHPVTLDKRNGAIHVPIADLNHDGRLDVVVLISQQHEQIVAYLNEGHGLFTPRTIHDAGDPAYGSTGIQLADLDGDRDLDVLYTNGDLMDSGLLKPYHSVQWLENEGGFPFRHHHLAPLPGVHRAVAGDLDGDGDLDVVAAAFVPDTAFFEREQWPLNALLWIEQTEPRRFVAHPIETVTCDHATVDLADFDRDGDLDFVTGNITWAGISGTRTAPLKPGWITIWENLGPELHPNVAPPVGSANP